MNRLLCEKIAQEESLFHSFIEIPDYIDENLKHPLRYYQNMALLYFIQTQEGYLSNVTYNHLLFKMATGAGKTNVMAAAMLYLYKEKGYNKFLFYVNSDAIINKTYENFFNAKSNKFLFKNKELFVDGERITLSYVNSYPRYPSKNTIYLKFTTVQKLHMDLKFPSENSLTYDDLTMSKLVMLSDEAHHLNATTKKAKKGNVLDDGWENTVLKILNLSPENRLLEFTATLDLTNSELLTKYQDKIIYNYELRNFMLDRYSKNVSLIRSNDDDQDKILNAVLLSQYRKYIALKNGIYIKPVILFKSNSIKVSVQTHARFIEFIQNLDSNKLQGFINSNSIVASEGSIFSQMYQFYQSMDLIKVVKDLKFDFREENLLNANDKEFVSPKNVKLLNSLESMENNIRGIFAVAKLNEGWDVLNLFDIVRISEGAAKTKSITDSEAQLIGRGARYYPFPYQGEKSFKRRFDNTDNELIILEQLHYHTINDNSYIKHLNKSLNEADIVVVEDSRITLNAEVKESFINSSVYKNGFLYVNKTIDPPSENYKTFKDLSVQTYYEYEADEFIEQQVYTNIEHRAMIALQETDIKLNKNIWRKALLKNRFFDLQNLKKIFTNLDGIEEFILSKDYLGGVNLTLRYPKGQELIYLSLNTIIKYLERTLTQIKRQIILNNSKKIGTTEFEAVPIKEVVKDYSISINPIVNLSFNEKVSSYPMKKKDWFVYDNAIVNGLEWDFIGYFEGILDEIYSKYSEVYLIRNEQQIKLVEFNGVRGFMPDFFLYLKELDQVYQILIEPKGEFLYFNDKWKEDMLLKLNSLPNVINLAENNTAKVYGLEFFSKEPQRRERFKAQFREIVGISNTKDKDAF
ncbi:DEAD/DEAH box helicase family protein [Psychrobacillus sp. NPDC096623]|uniref:DEAD/DEAH box helicase family protein n=1 Tax=Psychrobacillus sp. NPDC096623 TaxID=3364492 RepID=UPI0038221DF9